MEDEGRVYCSTLAHLRANVHANRKPLEANLTPSPLVWVGAATPQWHNLPALGCPTAPPTPNGSPNSISRAQGGATLAVACPAISPEPILQIIRFGWVTLLGGDLGR